MDLDQHEKQGEEDHDHRLSPGDSEELAENEDGPGDGLRDHREDGSVVDFPGEHVGGHEGRENRATDEDRGKTDVHEHSLVVREGVGAERVAQHHQEAAGHQNHEKHRLPDAFEEGVAGDREKLFEGRHLETGLPGVLTGDGLLAT